MYLGDNILKGGIEEYVKEFQESEADAHIYSQKYQIPKDLELRSWTKKEMLLSL